MAVFAQVINPRGFGADIVPDPHPPRWVAPVAVAGLLIITMGVLVIRATTYKPPKRHR